jgi:cbb3-type cytochrome oxidase subunit 3
MEGAMDQPMRKSDIDFDYDSYGLERRLDTERAPDAAGYWFLAAVLFAFIAAGIIVYRAGNNAEMQTAANYSDHPAAQTSRLDPHPLLQAR